jgi:hypothetical protein
VPFFTSPRVRRCRRNSSSTDKPTAISTIAINPHSFILFSVLAQQPAEAGDRRRARELLARVRNYRCAGWALMVTSPDSPAPAFRRIADGAKSMIPCRLLRLVTGPRSFVCNRSTHTQDCDWRPDCRGGGPPDGKRKDRGRPVAPPSRILGSATSAMHTLDLCPSSHSARRRAAAPRGYRFDDPPPFDREDARGLPQCRQPMAIKMTVRFWQMRRILAWIAASLSEIERRGRLVENQDPQVDDQGASDRDALALSAWSRSAGTSVAFIVATRCVRSHVTRRWRELDSNFRFRATPSALSTISSQAAGMLSRHIRRHSARSSPRSLGNDTTKPID